MQRSRDDGADGQASAGRVDLAGMMAQLLGRSLGASMTTPGMPATMLRFSKKLVLGGVAGVFAFAALLFTLVAVMFALDAIAPAWLAALLTAVLAASVAAAAGLLAYGGGAVGERWQRRQERTPQPSVSSIFEQMWAERMGWGVPPQPDVRAEPPRPASSPTNSEATRERIDR